MPEKPKPHPSSVHVKDHAPPSRLCGWQRDFKTGEYNRNNVCVLSWLPGGRALRRR